MVTPQKIGFGGSCHWCTEAIFQSLLGITNVAQGWISAQEATIFSEAVIVTFLAKEISLETLIEIHLHTHSCTAQHSMRKKYRSAIYCFDEKQFIQSTCILEKLQPQYENNIITQVLMFNDFKMNNDNFLNYYFSNPEKPFCTNVIEPKLKNMAEKFGENMHNKKIKSHKEYEKRTAKNKK